MYVCTGGYSKSNNQSLNVLYYVLCTYVHFKRAFFFLDSFFYNVWYVNVTVKLQISSTSANICACCGSHLIAIFFGSILLDTVYITRVVLI